MLQQLLGVDVNKPTGSLMEPINEEQIEESLENLNQLLALQQQPKQERTKAQQRMSERLEVNLDKTPSPVARNVAAKDYKNPFTAQTFEYQPKPQA